MLPGINRIARIDGRPLRVQPSHLVPDIIPSLFVLVVPSSLRPKRASLVDHLTPSHRLISKALMISIGLLGRLDRTLAPPRLLAMQTQGLASRPCALKRLHAQLVPQLGQHSYTPRSCGQRRRHAGAQQQRRGQRNLYILASLLKVDRDPLTQ